MKVVGAMVPGGVAARLDGAGLVALRSGTVACGLREFPTPAWDRSLSGIDKAALIRISAFSCNYRDIAFIRLGLARSRGNEVVPFGSEFCATVLEVGDEVAHIKPGDRVFGAFTYPLARDPSLTAGILSNECSKEIMLVPAAKLQVVPDDMNDVEAAAFSLNGLTVASMFMRLEVPRRRRVLVLAARSNVGLLACGAGAALGAHVTAVTTSADAAERIRQLGAAETVVLQDPAAGLVNCQELKRIADRQDGFEAVIDPFMDVHLHQVGDLMAAQGRYITCGSAKQVPEDATSHVASVDWLYRHFYPSLLTKNLEFYGNCLGDGTALEFMLDLWARRAMIPIIDSVYTEGQEADFLRRSFVDRSRFGKVVYAFRSSPGFPFAQERGVPR